MDDAAHALNTMVHATTGAQPYFAFFSRHARRYVGIPLPTIDNEMRREGVSEAHKIIQQTSKLLSKKILEIANRNRVNDESLQVGDLVLVLNQYQIPGTAKKLNKKWLGPYKVEKVIREGAAYQMSNPFDPEQNLLSRAAEKVKRFYPESDFLEILEREVLDEQEDEEVVVTDEEPVEEVPSLRYPQRVRRPKVPYTP